MNMVEPTDPTSTAHFARHACAAIALAFIALGCSSGDAVRPSESRVSIISVEQWGGTPAFVDRPHQTVRTITIHHQGETFLRTDDPVTYLRHLQDWSQTTKHWIDIPYHFLIDPDGTIYEGRNLQYAGDTNTEYDPDGHALICVLGNFEEVEPNEQQLNAVAMLSAMLCRKFNIAVEGIRSHRDYSRQTVCPGKNLYRYVQNGDIHRRIRTILERVQPEGIQ
jgi:hypothetical protein